MICLNIKTKKIIHQKIVKQNKIMKENHIFFQTMMKIIKVLFFINNKSGKSEYNRLNPKSF